MNLSEAETERERDIPTRLKAIESSLLRLDNAITTIVERTSMVRPDESDAKDLKEKVEEIASPNTKLGRDLQAYIDQIETSTDRLNSLCSALEI